MVDKWSSKNNKKSAVILILPLHSKWSHPGQGTVFSNISGGVVETLRNPLYSCLLFSLAYINCTKKQVSLWKFLYACIIYFDCIHLSVTLPCPYLPTRTGSPVPNSSPSFCLIFLKHTHISSGICYMVKEHSDQSLTFW